MNEKQLAKLQDYRRTFESPHGKKVLYDLMRASNMLSVSHVRGDPYETAFREGERNMVIRILQVLKMDPKKLEEFIKGNEE